jgi:hypothetical protein
MDFSLIAPVGTSFVAHDRRVTLEIVINSAGDVRFVYDEAVDLSALGKLAIHRGSHVEPDKDGCWVADMSPVNGPSLGPYPCRSEALIAEVQWLTTNWLVDDTVT